MAYLKPGHWTRKYFTKNYWTTRFQYWPGFEIKSHALLLQKELRNPKIYKYESRLELELKILSKYKLIKSIKKITEIDIKSEYKLVKTKVSNDYLLMLDEDLWLSEL